MQTSHIMCHKQQCKNINSHILLTNSMPLNSAPLYMLSYICYVFTEIPEVNFFAFAYRLFHEDFSSIGWRSFVYKSSPSSTLQLVIPEQI